MFSFFKRPALPGDSEPMSSRDLINVYDVEKAARNDAVRGRPREGETDPVVILALREGVDRRIGARYVERQDGEQGIKSTVEMLGERCSDRSGKALADEVCELTLLAYRDLEPMIRKCVTEEEAAKTAYAAWRDERGICRLPRYADAKIAYLAPVCVCALGETLLLTNMYAEAGQSGWIGGFGIALCLTVANALLGFMGGLFPTRYLIRGD